MIDQDAGTQAVAADEDESGGPCRAAPGRLPATLYERWRSAFHVDGVAFGVRVRELRELRGWTQKDLQDRTGVPISTISELETGRSARPRMALNMTLAQAFGFEHPGAMLGLEQPPRPPGTHPAGPRTDPSERGAEGPGPLTLEALVASLLRGVWSAQQTYPAAPEAVQGVSPATPAEAARAQSLLARVPGLGGTPVFVGAVFLVEPKTVG